jgi:hypothetical protein
MLPWQPPPTRVSLPKSSAAFAKTPISTAGAAYPQKDLVLHPFPTFLSYRSTFQTFCIPRATLSPSSAPARDPNQCPPPITNASVVPPKPVARQQNQTHPRPNVKPVAHHRATMSRRRNSPSRRSSSGGERDIERLIAQAISCSHARIDTHPPPPPEIPGNKLILLPLPLPGIHFAWTVLHNSTP